MMKLRHNKMTLHVVILYMSFTLVLANDDGFDSTTEFDYASRGSLKFGDKCITTKDCGFPRSICYQSYCTCSPEYLSTNHVDKCGKAVYVNETCFFNEQCEDSMPETECRDGRCICRFDKTAITMTDGSVECIDYGSRGSLKFGDKCETSKQCGFAGSICYQSYCTCSPENMSTNHVDKCGKAVSVNETCFFNEQCEDMTPETECRDGRCICRFDKTPITKKDGSVECIAIKEKDTTPATQVNPAMYLILVVMALMFIIICVVLRLFSKARWRENRTIFNTPNPRLMNVSLLRDNKLLHGGERRGSRMSVRMPSRQPSMASLRPHSPNASIGSRRGSRNSSSASAASNCNHEHNTNNHHTVLTNPNDLLNFNQQQHVQHQLIIHQQQRRRSSVHQAALQHAQHSQHASPAVQNAPQHPPAVQTSQPENKIQDVKVEITEVKP